MGGQCRGILGSNPNWAGHMLGGEGGLMAEGSRGGGLGGMTGARSESGQDGFGAAQGRSAEWTVE